MNREKKAVFIFWLSKKNQNELKIGFKAQVGASLDLLVLLITQAL